MLQSWLLKKYKNTAVQTLLCLKRTWGEKWDTTHFHEKVIDVDDHLPFGWLSIDLEAQNCQNVINQVNNTTCVTVWMCVNVLSTGMWAPLEKRPAAGWESVRDWLMRCCMSSRQPWAPVRSTARFDLSLLCLSTKVYAFSGAPPIILAGLVVQFYFLLPNHFQYSAGALFHC